ncbi:MAG: hypothetical protein GX594_08115 [Pirellulaceae bacterium]|nr:hypothetical protein [Pirellulaceae bacterium]
MQINASEIIEQGDTVKIQSLIEHGSGSEYLWYEMERKYAPYLTSKLDGFLVAVLPLAMARGENIRVNGAVSETLLYNLSNSYIHLLRGANPDYGRVTIDALILDDGASSPCANAVGTGFSGGIDSFCVLVDHFLQCPYPHYRISHCVFNNVGSHGSGPSDENRRLFWERYALVKPCLEELGLPLLSIDSNLTEFLKIKYQATHIPRNLSAVLLLQGLFGKYLYASAYHYKDCHYQQTHNLAFTDPAAVHLLSTETFHCISTGCQYTRVEKTAKVSDWDAAQRHLNVCVNKDAKGLNCSICEKCCRTIATLELLGKLDFFGGVFDLEKYRSVRNWFLSSCFQNKEDPFCKEIVDFWREQERNGRRYEAFREGA